MKIIVNFLCLPVVSVWLSGELSLAREKYSTIHDDISFKGGKNCSARNGRKLLHKFNQNRRINHFSALTLSYKLTLAAERLKYDVDDITLTTSRSSKFGMLLSEISTGVNDPLDFNDFPRLTGVDPDSDDPYWTTKLIPPQDKDHYSDKRWSNTARMGVACVANDDGTFRWRRVVVFFDYDKHRPDSTTTTTTTRKPTTTKPITDKPAPSPIPPDAVHFKVPMKEDSPCPEKFTDAIFAKINSQRRAEDIPPLKYSFIVAGEAQEWAKAGKEGKDEVKPNEKTYLQLNWMRMWDSTAHEFDISPMQPFTEKWTEKFSMPLCTGDGTAKKCTIAQVTAAKKMGVGCFIRLTNANNPTMNTVQFHLAVFMK